MVVVGGRWRERESERERERERRGEYMCCLSQSPSPPFSHSVSLLSLLSFIGLSVS